MVKNTGFILLITALFIGISAGPGFGEETTVEQGGKVPAQLTSEMDVQWLWGEVISIDIERSQLLLKYLDYELDQEKEITITVDPKTTYENVQSYTQIKPKDTVSVDYIVEASGRNLVKNITVEKPEDLEAAGEGAMAESSAAADTSADTIEAQLDKAAQQQ